MNTGPDPETSGLAHLTRLQSIAKQLDECDEQSICNYSVSLINQSSHNQTIDSASNCSTTNHKPSSIHRVSTSTTIKNQSHYDCQSHHEHTEINVEPERTYRSKSFANPRKNRLQSFSVIEKQDLYRQNHLSDSEPHSWSFKHLKNEFKANNFEKLFNKYNIRVQHNFFILLLLLMIAFNTIGIALYYIYDRKLNVHVGIAYIRLFCIVTNAIMLAIMFSSELYLHQKQSRVFCSALTLILIFVCEYSPAVFAMIHPQSVILLQRVRPTYVLILCNHVFLPHPKPIYAFYYTAIIVMIETTLTIYSRIYSECVGTSIVRYTIADFLFHIACSFIGYFINTMLEVANRRAFLVYRSCIEGKFHLTNQLKQQDDLLNTCIPKHLTERVQEDLKQALLDLKINRNLPCKPFNELYVEKYTDVTILYADIVNSMALAAKLSAQQLVITLNELYRRFDQVTEYNRCLRIKLLGDCYYCVSGCDKEYQKNHAENCVNTGLAMLDIIKDVSEKCQVDGLNMRIGIHTGLVMSGLMGLYKWQYDIWSLDSMHASEMEHTGCSGMLHLTSETLNCLSYKFRNKLLIKERFDLDATKTTFLVQKKYEEDLSLIARLKSNKKDNEADVSSSLTTIKKGFDPTILIERTLQDLQFLILSILKYREMVNFVNSILESAIDEMPLTKKEEWFHSRGIQPLFLLFRTVLSKTFNLTFVEMEKKFSLQLDPLYQYYLYCAALICVSIILIKYSVPKMDLPSKLIYSLFTAIGIIIFSIIIVHYNKRRLHLIVRLVIWLVVSGVLICCATIDLISSDNCQINLENEKELVNCAFTWYYTYSMVLAITTVSIFIRINYYLKLALYIIFFTLFYKLIYDDNSMVNVIDKNGNKWNFFGHKPQVGHLYYVSVVTIILHLIDRQIEYIMRLDFQWTSKLENEREEAIQLGKINRLLLLNILPEHIVVRYMCDYVWIAPEIPYSESRKSVAVMFASIPNYSETYAENEMNGQGLKCLQILNEIIHDFDKLILFNEQFGEVVEKIKTIGSTYMAATGLRSKRDSVYGSIDSDEEEYRKLVVITMVDFAIEMLRKLQRFNKDALQELKLRIGIAVGPVIEGVIGASKPQYDIWGDTVNVASRMDSFGRQGRIHVTQEVADVLRDRVEYNLECRGEILVKGKGKMITYLLRTAYDDDDSKNERESTVI